MITVRREFPGLPRYCGIGGCVVLVFALAFASGRLDAQETPPNAAPAQTDVQQLETLQKRHAAAPDEPLYEYGIESRVNTDANVMALHTQIAAVEARVAALREKYVEGAPQLKKAGEELNALKKRVAEIQRELRAQALDNTLARARGNEPLADSEGLQAYPVDELVAADPRVAEVAAEIAPVEVKYQQMKATYVADAPQLKALQRKLDDLNEKLARAKALVRQEVVSAARLSPQGSGLTPGPGAGLSAPAAAPADWTAAQPLRSREENALNSPITLDFQGAHLQTIVDKISETLGLNMVVDARVVAPPGSKPSTPSTPPTPSTPSTPEYATDGVVQTLKLNAVPLRDALRSLLTPLGLDYSMQPGFIWISTPKRVRHESFETLETRKYPLREAGDFTPYNVNHGLPGAPEGGLDLVDLLRKAVPDILEPSTGAALSRLEYDAPTRLLTVHNTPTNLRKVETLLDMLDAIP